MSYLKNPRQPSVDMSKEAIGERLRTQNNLMTAEPMYLVQVKKRTYLLEDSYETYNHVWLDDEGNEVGAAKHKALEKKWEGGEDCDAYRRMYTHDTWEFVTCCFTMEAAKATKTHYETRSENGGREFRIYVDSGYRNDEWQAVRRILMTGEAL